MPIITPYQSSFASGYLSPKLQGRIDLEQYYAGAADLTNWAVHPQGPIQRRNGSEFIDNFLDNYAHLEEDSYLNYVKFVPFVYSLDKVIMLAFTPNYIFAYTEGGVIMKGGQRLAIPWFRGYATSVPTYSTAQQGPTMVVCGPAFPPTKITCKGWTDWEVEYIDFIEQPDEWGPPAGDSTGVDDHPVGWWSDSKKWNWPQHCCFFDRRLVFAGIETNPTGVWMSRTGWWWDFTPITTITAGDTTDSEVADTDAVIYTIASDDASPITWMMPFSILAIGTQMAEYKCAASNLNEAITPNNVRITRQTNYGAADVPARMIGTDAAFVSRNRRALMIYAFNYLTDSWDATNATMFADDICNAGVRDLAVQAVPDSNIWLVLDDGRLAKYAYDKKQKISCWTLYEFPDAKVLNVGVLPSDLFDEVWLYIQRDIPGSDEKHFYVERLSPEVYDIYKPEEAKCLDSNLVYEGPPANFFQGLSHLNGERVRALIDGKDAGEFLVSGGSVKLPQSGSYVVIGKNFVSNFVSMEIHDQQNLTVGNERSLYRTDIWLNHAAGLKVGLIPGDVTDYKSYTPNYEPAIPTDKLYSGIHRNNARCSAVHGVRVNIRTISALPATILGFKSYMEIN